MMLPIATRSWLSAFVLMMNCTGCPSGSRSTPSDPFLNPASASVAAALSGLYGYCVTLGLKKNLSAGLSGPYWGIAWPA